jgi:hypothetical protein
MGRRGHVVMHINYSLQFRMDREREGEISPLNLGES